MSFLIFSRRFGWIEFLIDTELLLSSDALHETTLPHSLIHLLCIKAYLLPGRLGLFVSQKRIKIGNCLFQSLSQLNRRYPIQGFFRQRNVGAALDWIINRQGFKNDLGF